MDNFSTIFTGGVFMIIIFYLLVVIFNIAIFTFIIKTIINALKRASNHTFFKNNIINNVENINSGIHKRTYNDVSKAKLQKFNTDDINTLKDFFYDIFLNFENAYNNLDYNTMKILSTKELYHNYYTGISLDLKSGKKRIIKDIERKNVVIFELDSTILKQTASAMIEISYINYTIDKKGNIIKGIKDNIVTEKFEVVFRKDFERDDITKCPNCGASIVGNKCDFCRTNIANVEFKISSIKKIVE